MSIERAEHEEALIRARLKAPCAGAIAGIVFSVLLILGLVLFRLTIPAHPHDAGIWLSSSLLFEVFHPAGRD